MQKPHESVAIGATPDVQDPAPVSGPLTDRVSLDGRTLRTHVARGAIVNGAYVVFLQTLTFAKGIVVAGLVTTAEYGLWGILWLTLGMLVAMKQVGTSDKYVQQSEGDQDAAFQKALTFELLFGTTVCLLMLAAAPLLVVVYGEDELLAPALVLALYIPAASLKLPLWTYYRRMQFVRQRLIEGVEPLVAFAVTIPLAISGAGYWSLVIGLVAGAWCAAAAAVVLSPHRLRLRWERGSIREYFHFSWPLVLSAAATMIVAQASIIAGDATVGLAGVGAIALAVTIAQYTERLDFILSQTLYPAICAVQDRAGVLLETFSKSNRVGLMWGVPFGIGLALFAQDLVDFGIGRKWEPAVVLLQVFGINQTLHQVGFNWDSFYRARGDTRPVAVLAVVVLMAFATTALPLLIAYGLDGFAAGMAVVTVAALAVRVHYLRRLFPTFRLVPYLGRAYLPVVPAAAAVLLLRALSDAERAGSTALAELALFVALATMLTLLFERRLVSELIGYLRRARPAGMAAGN